MKRHLPKKQQHKRSGVVILIALVVITMFCMIAGVVVDLGYMYGCKSRIQNSADAAALAAVMRIGNENTAATRAEAKTWAIGFANKNLPGRGAVLVEDDIVFGMWDPGTREFTPGGTTPNAVQVKVRRDGKNTDSVGTFFMNFFGTKEIGLTTTAIATISTSAEGVPMALRAPSFGSVDSDVTTANPGKDGPSSPANGTSFEVGKQVIVCIYGKGSQPPVHLTIDVLGTADVKKILKGESDPVEMQVGDEAFVFNEGTGNGGFGSAIDDRLNLADSNPARDIVMPVLETLPGSRDADGKLIGKVRISDFVAVHLDAIVEKDIVDPDNSSKPAFPR